MVIVSDPGKGWDWVARTLANHFLFTERTVIRFFGWDRVLVIKNDRQSLIERKEIIEEEVLIRMGES